jgi:hypothetical protein
MTNGALVSQPSSAAYETRRHAHRGRDRTLDANHLRSLYAIHLASAQQLDGELDALVTYDERMLAAGRALGLPVTLPT